jgi:hypothetical protein
LTENNSNQKKLCGIDAIQQHSLTDILQESISKYGLVRLANEINCDKSALSRFKNGEGALSLAQLESLMEYCDVVLIQKQRYRRLMYTIITLSEFLKESIGW